MKRLVVPAVLLVASTASAEPRRGVTFDASLGVGVMHVDFGGIEQTKVAASGLNLGYGLWVHPTTALALRLTATTISPDSFQAQTAFLTSLTLTVGVQHFVTETVFAGAGVGIGRAARNLDTNYPGTSFAVSLRAGVVVARSQHGAYYLAAEVIPTHVLDERVTTATLQFGWQLF